MGGIWKLERYPIWEGFEDEDDDDNKKAVAMSVLFRYIDIRVPVVGMCVAKQHQLGFFLISCLELLLCLYVYYQRYYPKERETRVRFYRH